MKNGLKEFIGNRKVGITLGSGGAKGVSHIGVLEVLGENGVIINEISGCSIGSIIGAAYASGMSIEKMKELAFNINLKNVWNLFDFTNPFKGGLVKGDMVIELLEKMLSVKTFEELEIPFRCVATNVETGEQEIFDSGDLIPALRASISIPGFFIPSRNKNKLLVDGGVINPLPVNLLYDSDFKIAVIVEEYKALNTLAEKKVTIEEYINNKFNIDIKPTIDQLLNKKIKSIEFLRNMSGSINNMIKQIAETDLDAYDINLIVKPDMRDIATLAFHEGKKSYKKGYNTAKMIIKNSAWID